MIELDATVLQLIKRKARRLIGKHGFTASDRDDLEQDLLVHLLERLQANNLSADNPEAFVATMIDNLIASLIRKRRAEKRDHRRLSSLNERVADGEGDKVEAWRLLPDNQVRKHRGVHERGGQERGELVMDLEVVLANLPEDLRDLCERLKNQSMVEIVRETGTTWEALHENIRRIRHHFEKAGLRNYL